MTATTITDPVGISEIAERLNVQRQTVNSWRSRGKEDRERSTPIPQPAAIVSGTPIWDWDTIRAWALDTGRLPASGSWAMTNTEARGLIDQGARQ